MRLRDFDLSTIDKVTNLDKEAIFQILYALKSYRKAVQRLREEQYEGGTVDRVAWITFLGEIGDIELELISDNVLGDWEI
jgi:hypothetical protein